jgi:hypothetical protein
MLVWAVLRLGMQFQHRSGLRSQWSATRSVRVLALGSLTLCASCNGTLRDAGVAASGGTSAIGGTTASGGTAASGGIPAAGGDLHANAGSSEHFGGAAGSAGAPALAPCGCSDDGAITVEFTEGSRVYRRLEVEGSGCNPLTCSPEAPYAAIEGAISFRLDMRACDEDGECIVVQTGSLEDGVSQGEVIRMTDGRETLREPAMVATTRFLDAQEPRVEFTFQTDTAEDSIRGSGRVCWATSEYICLF